MKKMIDHIAKALAGGATAAAAAYAQAVVTPGITRNEWITVALAAVGGTGLTYLVPPGIWKTVASGLTAAATAYLQALVSPGVTRSEWVAVGAALLVGSGLTHLVTNGPDPTAAPELG
jgi:hypothetical protein